MPITEHRVSFLYEAWTLFGIGTLVLLTRFAVRLKTVGFRGLQSDDAFSVLVLIFYIMDAATVHYFLGTNVEANVLAKTSKLSKSDLSDFLLGSKLQLVAWYTYTALIWSLKGTMLCFFSRMTVGTWHNRLVKGISICCVLSYAAVFLTITFGCFPTQKNWQVLPNPGEKCTFKMQNFLVTTVLNVITDASILCIPMPLLWTLQVPLRKKLVIMVLLSSGAFVIAAAIIRVVLTLSASPSALTINGWGVRETIVGIITVNIPILRPLFSRAFWTTGAVSRSSNMRSTTAGGKPSTISGAYELTPSINDGTTGFRMGRRPSADGSQESIIGKKDSPAKVTVQTTYEITSGQDHGDDNWRGLGGGNKTSIYGGSNNV